MRNDARSTALFERPVATLKGVGPRVGERLARLGVQRVGDLLCLLPQRYEDRSSVRPIGSLVPGEKVLVEGTVELAEVVLRRRRSLLCRLADGTGALTLRFFHFHDGQKRALARGARVRCYGEVRPGPTGLEMVHPEHRAVTSEDEGPAAILTAIYPSTEGLHQQKLRQLLDDVLDALAETPVPDELHDELDASWPSLNEALTFLHRPPRDVDAALLMAGRHPAQRRIALEELIAQRLALKRASLGAERERATALEVSPATLARFRAALPFTLTGAQSRALGEIAADLARDRPMHRLLQGDVGSGKTAVAAAAAFVAADAGRQTAVMAPTELLAEQHHASFARWLEPLGVGVVLVTGSQTARRRAAALETVASGGCRVVVGTHALFQEAVAFHDLALIVVDEQHRFGVEQRLTLKRKGAKHSGVPHQLVMTATPIPRTLAMTAYADLDCSVIDELPPGRTPVRTAALPEQRRPELVERIAAHCAAGRQAYWVCPLIDESDLVDSSAATALGAELGQALPQLRVGLIHGRMPAAEKEAVMRAFKEAQLDLLVATTVIEVGVDVPNATLMVVENSERMGLAQLHQLRGRVGRGEHASSCVLLYKPPLGAVARARLDVMRSTNDGFAIAEKDLELRGPGEVLGTRQTGLVELRVADLARDADLLPLVVELSDRLLGAYPDRVAALIRRWVRAEADYAKV